MSKYGCDFTEADMKYYLENGWYGALRELCEEEEECSNE